MTKIKKPGSEEIAKAKNNEHIIQQTAEQIIKDFALFGLDISFSGDTKMAYPELKNQICFQLEKIIDTHFEKIRGLLYQIDISEQKIKQELHNTEKSEYTSVLADLIIERELKKVLLRQYFKEITKQGE